MHNAIQTIQCNPTTKTTAQPETIQLYTYEDAIALYKQRIKATIKEALDQKLLGACLLLIGIIGCCIIPEEATAFIFSGIVGIARLVTN